MEVLFQHLQINLDATLPYRFLPSQRGRKRLIVMRKMENILYKAMIDRIVGNSKKCNCNILFFRQGELMVYKKTIKFNKISSPTGGEGFDISEEV